MSILIKDNKWAQLVKRWESESILNGLADMINRENNPPHVEELLKIILGFVSTLYYNAYPDGNSARLFYTKRRMQLKGLDRCTPDTLDQQRSLFHKSKKSMPRGFANCFLEGGILYTYNMKKMTLNKANQFLDYLESDDFQISMRWIEL